MKIAGLMCWHYDPNKTHKHRDSLAELCAMTDEVFILDDQSDPPFPKEYLEKYPKIQSVIRLDEREHGWNDWTAHCTLLIAAAKRKFGYVLWLDDDESFWPSADRKWLEPALKEMERNPTAVSMRLPWEQIWKSEHTIIRGGGWNTLTKPFIQKNPFYISGLICFPNAANTELHSWPIQTGNVLLYNDIRVLHWALMTVEDRQRYVQKYMKNDPEGKYLEKNFIVKSCLNEEEVKLENLNERINPIL